MGSPGDVTGWVAVVVVPSIIAARQQGGVMEGWFLLFAVVAAVWVILRD